MRTLHVYRTYYPDPPGGLQEAIRQIALATTACGVDNTIFTLSPNPSPAVLERPEATVVRCRSWMAPASCDIGGLNAMRTYARLCADVDVVHNFFPWPYADLLDLLTLQNKPLVVTYISDIVRQRFLGKLYAPLMRHTLQKAAVIVANAPAYVESSPILSRPEFRDKIKVIPLGIDESSYPGQGDARIFKRLAMNSREPFFLFIGVLRYYKGLHFLLEAAQRIKAPIVIAGTGPEEVALKQKAADLKLENVVFAGHITQKEKVALLRSCLALVLPSHLRSEAFGMVLVEASMFGKPMISCELGTGTSFVNKHEKTGFVVPPNCPWSLSDKMNSLLEDKLLAQTMGKAARHRYEEKFSSLALGQAYSKLFEDVVKR